VTSQGDESVRAFIPPPLPPSPTVRLDHLQILLEQANQSLGRLDGVASILPNVSLFLYFHVRKEAVLSSQIEGTQSSLSDLLLFEMDEAPGALTADAAEVSNYVGALQHGLNRMREGFPFSLRLIREIHGHLLAGARGADKLPGEFRSSQNWIGGTRPGNAIFVPPPHDHVIALMGQLETFLHAETGLLPPLVKIGLAHVQFETIHPFLDGNGRLGRLLITLLLCSHGVLKEPLLYLSLFFKMNRSTYYDLLMRVRQLGDWEAWLEFFLTGVRNTSDQAVDAAQRVLNLFRDDQEVIGKANLQTATLTRVLQHFQSRPILSIGETSKHLGLAFPTVSRSMEQLQRLNIVSELTGKARNRLFAYTRYLAILNEGTEPAR
jgi:Fic family protein